ncbi:hypothetical protein H5410_056504 [Solanum commersonii]|uniref:Uncharacterized protein n=1 Tax=Solanum commersonii TaxID=4109 RepID=A0A9J5WLH3_SOLCO|nr:hypothetical protein H5410_056504 [Solanum commersonii]
MTLEIRITKRSMDYAHENWQSRGLLIGNNQIHSYGLDGRPRKNLAKTMSKIWITKRFMDYSTQISAKRGVYTLQGSFDHENESFCPSRPTGSISKVWMDIH